MFPGLFLDRDGVIIQNKADYIRTWKDVVFIPNSLTALARLKTSLYKIAIITNQSGIGRGLIEPQTARQINHQLTDEISKTGGRIDGVFMCPHHPEDGCACRKPRPGLIFQAAEALQIDLKNSILVGDNLTDLQAGQSAGVAQLALVRTGLGSVQLQATPPGDLAHFQVFSDLYEALTRLIP